MKPTEQDINNWKAEFGKIFSTTIDGEQYIWRKLKRKEYVSIMVNNVAEENKTAAQTEETLYKNQEIIVVTTVLFPEDIVDRLENTAGLATGLSEEIILKSGFGIPKTEEL